MRLEAVVTHHLWPPISSNSHLFASGCAAVPGEEEEDDDDDEEVERAVVDLVVVAIESVQPFGTSLVEAADLFRAPPL